ncbi:MAG: hypothetical protein JOZ41_04380, partial [Chloroflexi bacterium]|nr:hypothetical protein [Chloroflexota bacterium]
MNLTRYLRPTLLGGLALAAALGATVQHTRAAATSPYAFASYAYPHDTFTQLLSVNNAGRIAGYHGEKVNKGITL